MAEHAGIRKLWAIAKSPDLKLTDEELHLLVEAYTGKESIKKLSQDELSIMFSVLNSMKSVSLKQTEKSRKQTRGNTGTRNQRRKIYKLCEELGWEKQSRINGMCRKMFQVESVEWLNYQQCSKLIEALKSMASRKEKNSAG